MESYLNAIKFIFIFSKINFINCIIISDSPGNPVDLTGKFVETLYIIFEMIIINDVVLSYVRSSHFH